MNKQDMVLRERNTGRTGRHGDSGQYRPDRPSQQQHAVVRNDDESGLVSKFYILRVQTI